MKAKLTDLSIAKLPFTGKQYTVWDEDLRGFGVRVYKAKTFTLKQGNRWYTLGRYPQCSLKQCRNEAKRRLALRYFPQVSIPTKHAVQHYLAAKKDEHRKASQHVFSHYLKRHFTIDKPVALLTASDVYAITDTLPKSSANLCFAVFKAFFSWCMERDYLTVNPLHKKKPPHKTKSRDRLLTDEEIRLIWKESYHHQSFGAIIRLLILSGQRLSQISNLQQTWLSASTISFPAYIMKGNQEHVIPITTLLSTQLNIPTKSPLPLSHTTLNPPQLTSSPNDTIFPKQSISAAMKKFREALNAPRLQQSSAPRAAHSLALPSAHAQAAPNSHSPHLPYPLTIPHFTLHDFRRYLSSKMSTLKVPIDITEAILAHQSGSRSPIQRVYDRDTRLPQMREALEKYHSHLRELLNLPEHP